MRAHRPLGFYSPDVVTDIWRDLHPLAAGFTWESSNHSRASRIDLIGCPSVWVPFVSNCNIVPCPFSDHAEVYLSLSPPIPIPRGPGRWKCNVSTIEDPELRTKIESFWMHWRTRQQFFPSVGKWWDKGKKQIKAIISHHSSIRAAKKRHEQDLLNRLASHLKTKLGAGMTSVAEPLESVLLSIADLNKTAAKGARVRARVKWAKEGLNQVLLSFRKEMWSRSMVFGPPQGGRFYCVEHKRHPYRVIVILFVLIFCGAHRSRGGGSSSPTLRVHPSSCMARGKAPGLDGLPLEFLSFVLASPCPRFIVSSKFFEMGISPSLYVLG